MFARLANQPRHDVVGSRPKQGQYLETISICSNLTTNAHKIVDFLQFSYGQNLVVTYGETHFVEQAHGRDVVRRVDAPPTIHPAIASDD